MPTVKTTVIAALLMTSGWNTSKCNEISKDTDADDDDSGSIELPNRRENRQKSNALISTLTDESILTWFSKLLSTFKLAVTMASRKLQEVHKLKGYPAQSRRVVRNLQKACNNVERATKYMFKSELN